MPHPPQQPFPRYQEIPTGNPFLRHRNNNIIQLKEDRKPLHQKPKKGRTWSDVYNQFLNEVRPTGYWTPEFYKGVESQCVHFRLIGQAIQMLRIIDQSPESTTKQAPIIKDIVNNIADAIGNGRPPAADHATNAKSYAEWYFLDQACLCGRIYLQFISEAAAKTYGRFDIPPNGVNNYINREVLFKMEKIDNPADLEATWQDLYWYGGAENWTHRAYEDALRTVLKGPLREVIDNYAYLTLEDKLAKLNELYSGEILARAKENLKQFRRGPSESILAMESRLSKTIERVREGWNATTREYYANNNIRYILTNSTSETFKSRIDKYYARCEDTGREVNPRSLAERIHEWESEIHYTHTHRPMHIEVRQTNLSQQEPAPDRASAYAKIRRDDKHEGRPASRPDDSTRRPSKSPYRNPDPTPPARSESQNRPVLRAIRPSSRERQPTQDPPRPQPRADPARPATERPSNTNRRDYSNENRSYSSDRREYSTDRRGYSYDRRDSRNRTPANTRSRYDSRDRDTSWSRQGDSYRGPQRYSQQERDRSRDQYPRPQPTRSRYDRYSQDRQRYQSRDQSSDRYRRVTPNRDRHQSPEWARKQAEDMRLERWYAHHDGRTYRSDNDQPGEQGWKRIYRTPSLNRYAVRGNWAPQVRSREYQNRTRTFFPTSSQRRDFVQIILGELREPSYSLPWQQPRRDRTPSAQRSLN